MHALIEILAAVRKELYVQATSSTVALWSKAVNVKRIPGFVVKLFSDGATMGNCLRSHEPKIENYSRSFACNQMQLCQKGKTLRPS